VEGENEDWLTFYGVCCCWNLKFLIAHYFKMCHFLWDSTHILCSARSSLIVLVFSQSGGNEISFQ